MAPSATSQITVPVINDAKLDSKQVEEPVHDTENYKSVRNGSAKPLKLKGVLDQYKSFDITPVLGREFDESVRLVDLIQAENSDELLRDLAITSLAHPP